MSKELDIDFYIRSPEIVAKDLIGKIIVKNKFAWVISETEWYGGSDDLASHAYKWKTSRNFPMFKTGAYSYVYLIYWMYHCFNIVTGDEWIPWAVLIRSVIPFSGIEKMRLNRNMFWKKIKGLSDGPGKFAQAFWIDKNHNCIDLISEKSPIKLYENNISKDLNIEATSRIWIKLAKDKLWRFVLK